MSQIYDYRDRHHLKSSQDENDSQQGRIPIFYSPTAALKLQPANNNVCATLTNHEIDLKPLNQNKLPKNKQKLLDPEIQDLVEYLRKPEPIYKKKTYFSFEEDSDFHDLGPINEKYISESPRLRPGYTFSNKEEFFAKSSVLSPSFLPISMKPQGQKLLSDDSKLDLSILSKYTPNIFDAMPLFHVHRYDPRVDKDDYEGKVLAMIEDEMMTDSSDRSFGFDQHLELDEKRHTTRWFDYPMYYLFGIDRSGYFELKERKKLLYNHPWSKYDRASYADAEEYEELDEDTDLSGSSSEESQSSINDLDTSSNMSLDRYL